MTENGDGQSWAPHQAGGKRGKLKRDNSLDDIDEEGHSPKVNYSKCPMSNYVFGVKSYLHHFYEADGGTCPTEDEEEHLVRSHRRCASIWWKVFVWIGINFLVFGLIGVCVGYLVPAKQIVIGSIAKDVEVIDPGAITFNFNLDVCKLVGLVLFCIGGITLATALLFPSIVDKYLDEERKVSYLDQDWRTSTSNVSNVYTPVPTSSVVKEIQPTRKSKEGVMTQEGTVAFQP